MAFLNFYSTAAELGMGTDSTVSGSFDPTYCANSIRMTNNVSGVAFGPGADSNESDVWFHYEIYGDNALMNGAGADGLYWTIQLNSLHSFICELSNGGIYLGTTTNFVTVSNLSTSIAAPWALARVAVDIRVQINAGGLDIMTVYHNEVQVMQTSISNGTTGATKVLGMSWVNNDLDGNVYLSQIMIANEDTRGLKLCTMAPNAAGDNSAWIGDHTNVIDGDGTFISSDTAGQREDWNLAAYPGPASPTGIRLFQKTRAAAGNSGGPQGLQNYLRIGGVNYDGATAVAPALSNPVVTEWATNPATGLPWATADLASLIAGVESIT